MRIAGAMFGFLLLAPAIHAAQTLDVYVLDVEGGTSVLMVSPSGESLLFDAGWPGYNGRDVDRILQATKAAGLKQIDYLVISHYDLDHLGDVPLLASKIPIKHFVDHGPLQTTRSDFAPRYNPYAAVRDKSEYQIN
jgi:beta-lactamase superfamily II metal-dependent hydrolase